MVLRRQDGEGKRMKSTEREQGQRKLKRQTRPCIGVKSLTGTAGMEPEHSTDWERVLDEGYATGQTRYIWVLGRELFCIIVRKGSCCVLSKDAGEDEHNLLRLLSPCNWDCDSSQWNFTSLINLMQIILHTCSQRFIYMLIANCIGLILKVNHQGKELGKVSSSNYMGLRCSELIL